MITDNRKGAEDMSILDPDPRYTFVSSHFATSVQRVKKWNCLCYICVYMLISNPAYIDRDSYLISPRSFKYQPLERSFKNHCQLCVCVCKFVLFFIFFVN